LSDRRPNAQDVQAEFDSEQAVGSPALNPHSNAFLYGPLGWFVFIVLVAGMFAGGLPRGVRILLDSAVFLWWLLVFSDLAGYRKRLGVAMALSLCAIAWFPLVYPRAWVLPVDIEILRIASFVVAPLVILSLAREDRAALR
jgi:hypothetical protein